jgi:hypothetical protein
MTEHDRLNELEEVRRLEDEVHKLWVPIEPTTEAEKIVASIHALNRSLDRRLDRLTDVLLNLARAIERRM